MRACHSFFLCARPTPLYKLVRVLMACADALLSGDACAGAKLCQIVLAAMPGQLYDQASGAQAQQSHKCIQLLTCPRLCLDLLLGRLEGDLDPCHGGEHMSAQARLCMSCQQ